jgi:hypothetical protein
MCQVKKTLHLKGKGTMYYNLKLFEISNVYSLTYIVEIANEL